MIIGYTYSLDHIIDLMGFDRDHASINVKTRKNYDENGA